MKIYRVKDGVIIQDGTTAYSYQTDWDELINREDLADHLCHFNGFPTGVEVCASMQHGGPYPATTDPRSTSVGTAAIKRFAHPVCYQNFPQEALPVELRDDNERGIWRLVNNRWSKA